MAIRATEQGMPVEGIGDIFPPQGDWSENEYWTMLERRRVEFTDGNVEILPMPTTKHQSILLFLLELLLMVSRTSHPGKVLPSGIKLRVRDAKIREPDIILALKINVKQFVSEQFWSGADLVVEVVSPDNPERDHEEKRLDYAEGRVPEYWIVDPQQQTFTVLTLRGDAYVEHGVFRPGDTASSVLLDGMPVDVAACFAAGQPVD